MEGGTAVPIGQVHVSIKRLLAQQEKTTRPRLLDGTFSSPVLEQTR